jgi:hypothetical protein
VAAVVALLLGVAWLALVLGMRRQLRAKAVAALPGLATLALAGAVAIGDADSFPTMLMFSIELSAVGALVRSRHGNQRLTAATSAAWQSCCGEQRPLVSST